MKLNKTQAYQVQSFRIDTLPYNRYNNTQKLIFETKDTMDLKNARVFLKEKLKNENTLYKLYSGIDTEIPLEILNNENFMAEMYQDVDFMKASTSALKRVIGDKLQSKALSDNDRSELETIYQLFSIQEEMFKNPENSFDTGLNVPVKQDIQRDKRIKIPQNLQPAFGSIFNYGFFDKPKTRRQKAEAIVNRAATAAAGESAFLLTFGTPTMEAAALTTTTINMCHKICKTYQMPGGAVSALIARISGQLVGKTLADYGKNVLGKFFPGIGNAVNATITYSLHQIQGRAIISWCEKNYNNPSVKNWDVAVKTFNIFRNVNAIIGNPVDNYIGAFGEEGLSDFINDSI